MDWFIRLSTCTVLIGIAALRWKWTDLFHVVCAVAALVPILGLLVLWQRSRRDDNDESFLVQDTDQENMRESPGRSVVFGVVAAVGCCAYLAFAFWILEGTRLCPVLYDRDRAQVEQRVRTLTEAGSYSAAATIIRERLGSKASTGWKLDLAKSLFHCLVESGRASTDLETSAGYFTEATSVATEHGIDTRLALTLSEQADRLIEMTERFRNLKDAAQWAELVPELQTVINNPPTVPCNSPLKWDVLLFNALIEWANACQEVEEKLNYYQEALKVAGRHDLNPEPARSLLKSIEMEEARQSDVMSNLDELQELGAWAELVTLLEHTMSQEKFAAKLGLEMRLYRTLVCWGDSASDFEQQVKLYSRAIDTAGRFNLDARDAKSRLLSIQAEASQRKAAEDQRSGMRRRLADLTKSSAFAELVALVRVSLEDASWQKSGIPFPELLRDSLTEWGDTLRDDEQKLTKYQLAVEAADTYGLENQLAEARLRATEKTIEERRNREKQANKPVDLPAGAQVGVARMSSENFPPFVGLDVWVENAAGVPISGLQAKDFAIHCDSGSVSQIVLSPLRQESSPLRVVVAIDTSGSTKGPGIAAAKEGAKAFLKSLVDPNVEVEVVSFAGEPRRVCSWTRDLGEAILSIESLEAEGHTALYNAIAFSMDDLAKKTGEKRLVLFTDGKDTVGGRTLTELLSRCEKDQVTVFSIGLKTEDLDSQVLRELSNASKGEYLEAVKPSELIELYRRTSRQVRREVYRFIVGLSQDSALQGPTSISLRVGGENAVETSTKLPTANARSGSVPNAAIRN